MKRLDTVQGSVTPLPADVRCVRTALEGLDPAALTSAARDQLAAMLEAAWAPLMVPPAGWRRAEQPPCLLALVGRNCGGTPGVSPCNCCRPWMRILDHRRMWSTPQGLVLIAEPYGLDLTSEEVVRFAGWCRGNGLSVHADGESTYFPGRTLRLVIRPEPAPGPGEVEDV
ncbi:MAG: hypothetical protein ACYC6F_17290 [Longimicrobiales bacterium]